VFLADDGVHGSEPWASDGTPAGTALLADACPGACGVFSDPPLVSLAGAAFFVAGVADTTKGNDLWTTDGTGGGTRRYTDFIPGTGQVLTTPITAGGGGSSSPPPIPRTAASSG